MQPQDCQNLTPDKVASYDDLLVIYLEKTVFDGLVKGFLTPLKLVRRGGCPVGYEPMDPPIVYDEKTGTHIDKRFAPLMVFSISEVANWELSWRKIPDSGNLSQALVADKIRCQLIAHEFIDRYNKSLKEVERVKSKLSTFRVQVEEKIVASVCPDEKQTQIADADHAMALPEPKKQQEPYWPPETEFLQLVYDLWVEGLEPKEKIKRLQESKYRVSKPAAEFLAKPASFLLKQVKRATDETGYVDNNRLSNARTSENGRLWGDYKDEGEDV